MYNKCTNSTTLWRNLRHDILGNKFKKHFFIACTLLLLSIKHGQYLSKVLIAQEYHIEHIQEYMRSMHVITMVSYYIKIFDNIQIYFLLYIIKSPELQRHGNTYKIASEKTMTFSYKIISFITGLRLEDSLYKWNEQLYNVLIIICGTKIFTKTYSIIKICFLCLIHMLKHFNKTVNIMI